MAGCAWEWKGTSGTAPAAQHVQLHPKELNRRLDLC